MPTRHLVVIAGQRHYPWYMLQFVAALFGQRIPKNRPVSPLPPGRSSSQPLTPRSSVMPVSVAVPCPMCTEVLDVGIEIEIKSDSARQSKRGLTMSVVTDLSAEGHEVIAEHLRVAHPEVS